MKPLEELSDSEYRALPYESYSSIKHLLDSPQTFLYYKSNPFTGSTSTLLGTAVHHYLQGNRHLVAYSVIDKRKKEEYAEFESTFRSIAGEEGIIVPKSFEEKVEAIMKNFNENSMASGLLSIGWCEYEKPFIFEHNGVQLKGKVDGLTSTDVVEIKTTSMAKDKDEFRYAALNMDYDLQAFLYTKATGKLGHYFVVCETTAPFNVKVFRSSKQFLESGRKKADLVTERYKKHIIDKEPFDENQTVEEI